MKKQGGLTANYTGNILEKFVKDRLNEREYAFVPKDKFRAMCYLEQPIYTQQFPIAKSIYDAQIYCDFIIYHPEKYPNCLIVECKWQQSKGSVDEKFPYTVANIKEKYPHVSIIILDGEGYKKQAKQWLIKQVEGNLLHVFNMMEFQKWVNRDNL